MSEPGGFLRRHSKVAEPFIYGLLLLFLSLTVFKLQMQIHATYLDSITDVTRSVLEGRPRWISFQSRLLGSWIVLLLTKAGISFRDAVQLFFFLVTPAQLFLLFALLRRMRFPRYAAFKYVAVFAAIFIAFQDPWLLPWDCIDVLVFTLVVFAIVREAPIGAFLALFAVSVLNRESALFISLYLIIDAFDYTAARNARLAPLDIVKGIRMVSKPKLAAGILSMAVGIAYAGLTRRYLFNGDPVLVAAGATGSALVMGNTPQVVGNIYNLVYRNFTSLDIINTIHFVGPAVYVGAFWRRYSAPYFNALLLYAALLVSIMSFGLINETRMYLILTPFLIFFHIEIERMRRADRVIT